MIVNNGEVIAIDAIVHDLTLSGTGRSDKPLGLSEEIKVKIDNKLDISSFNSYSADISEEINELYNKKLDTSAFSTVSGTFLTAHQDLSNYYTKDETSGKYEIYNEFNFAYNYINDLYDITDILSAAKQDNLTFEYNENNEISGINNSAIAQPKVDLSNYYTKDETSAASSLSAEFTNLYKTKQDKLTFNYNNLDEIYAINNSALAQTDLSDYYNKQEIDEKFANFGGFVTANSASTEPYGHPDVAKPDVKKIYLISAVGIPDKYFEWIYSIDGSTSAWECIGDTSIDLSDYYTKSETSGAGELDTAFIEIAGYIDNLYDITDELSATKQDNLIPADNIYISGNNEIGLSGKLPFNVDDSMYAVETSAGIYVGLNEYTTNEYFAGTFGTDFSNSDFMLSGDLFSANENIKYMNLSINYQVDNSLGNPDFVYKNELKISGAEINENYVHYIPGYISNDSYSVFLNVQNNSPFKFTLSSESTQHTGNEIKINVLGVKYHYPEEYEEIVDETDVDKIIVFNKSVNTIDAGDGYILVDDDNSTLDIGY